jgi:hypothetical protein
MMRTFCFIISITIGFTLISCTRDNAPQKEPSAPSTESPRIAGEYQKSLEESKKTIAAKVNGVPISRHDLVGEMNAIAPQYIKPGQKRDPKTDEKVRKEALDRLIYRELAVQEAKKQGMKAPPDAVAGELKRIKAEMKTEEAFRRNLSKSGITEEDLKRQIERNLIVEMITEKEIFGKVTVDPGEAIPMVGKKSTAAAVHKREDEWVAALKKGARIEIAP